MNREKRREICERDTISPPPKPHASEFCPRVINRIRIIEVPYQDLFSFAKAKSGNKLMCYIFSERTHQVCTFRHRCQHVLYEYEVHLTCQTPAGSFTGSAG